MTVTLIGSRAIKKWFPDFRDIAPSDDWDWQCDNDYEIVPGGMTLRGTPHMDDERNDWFRDPRLGNYPWGELATPDELYTMKISHGYWDINGTWDKHAADIVFLQRKGCKLIPELHDMLLEIWKERYPKNPISLDKSAKEFFNDHVHYIYVHDTVHESVAYGDRPWFESILREGSDVMVDSDKFWAMPLSDQLELCREELYVIALERILIPNDYKGSPMRAYRWALRRLCTSLFKNKWATFVLLHLDELSRPDVDYVKRHRDNAHKLRLVS